jgi:hypothetical protein
MVPHEVAVYRMLVLLHLAGLRHVLFDLLLVAYHLSGAIH